MRQRFRAGVGALLIAAVVAVGMAGSVPAARADATFPLHACSSRWVSAAGSAWGMSDTSWRRSPGPAANFLVSMKPTGLARNLRLWGSIWKDLRRCVRFPANLGARRTDSLYKQLICHAFWSTGSFLPDGGRTWDFEAWRPDESLAYVLSPAQALDRNKRCNWGPDTGPAMSR